MENLWEYLSLSEKVLMQQERNPKIILKLNKFYFNNQHYLKGKGHHKVRDLWSTGKNICQYVRVKS